MLKSYTWQFLFHTDRYDAAQMRAELQLFLAAFAIGQLWRDRLILVAGELIANACNHRFDGTSVSFEVKVVCFREQVKIQMVLDDNSNLLIMQRYRNLSQAVSRRHLQKPYKHIHGRGLEIIMHWTDALQFNKKRSGGLKIMVAKTLPLLLT